jgi:hypothetical protein
MDKIHCRDEAIQVLEVIFFAGEKGMLKGKVHPA